MNLKLFVAFLQISIYSFGGIYSIWALTQKTLVSDCEKPDLCIESVNYDQEEFDRIFGISRMIPGPRISGISILGYSLGGVATMGVILFGLVLPSLLIVPLLTSFYNKLAHKENVQNIRKGAQIAIVAILVIFLYGIISKGITPNLMQSSFYVATVFSVFLLNRYFRWSPIMLIGLSTICGYFLLN